MNEDIKKELECYLKKQPSSTLVRWIIVLLSFVSILAVAGAMNWWHDYQTNQHRVIKSLEVVGEDLKQVKNNVSLIKVDVSESKQIMEIVVKQLPPEPQKQARQIQEIYNQMKRDQYDGAKKIRSESYYNGPNDKNPTVDPDTDKKKL